MAGVSLGQARAEFRFKLRMALRRLKECAALERALNAEVDRFFTDNPAEPRTRWAQDCITVLVFEHLTQATES